MAGGLCEETHRDNERPIDLVGTPRTQLDFKGIKYSPDVGHDELHHLAGQFPTYTHLPEGVSRPTGAGSALNENIP